MHIVYHYLLGNQRNEISGGLNISEKLGNTADLRSGEVWAIINANYQTRAIEGFIIRS